MFKKGDKVKRVYGHDYDGVCSGGIYTVECDSQGNLHVEESKNVYSSDYFQLVKIKTPTRFEAGKWYIHPSKEHNSDWCHYMDGVLDGKPHKCVYGNGRTARFDCTSSGWGWVLDEFQECDAPYTLGNLFDSDDKEQTTGVKPMEPVKTILEENALKEAKAKQIELEVARKANEYKSQVQAWIEYEKNARSYRAQADELATLLKLTKEEKENLL